MSWAGKRSAEETRRREFMGEHSRLDSAKHYGTLVESREVFTVAGSRLMSKGLAALRQSAAALQRILHWPGTGGKSLPTGAASQETRMNEEVVIPSLRDRDDEDPTQLGTIRDLMLEAATRGDWLTLTEIAEPTAFGEASISAQLRHLRKARHGHYRVEKRRRLGGESEAGRITGLWEYQVLPPDQALPIREGGQHAKAGY